MKVLQMIPEMESGGVERGTLELARHLGRYGHESLVISGGGKMVSQLEACGTRHITMPVGRKRLSSLFFVRKLRKLFDQERPDILHLRSRVPAWLAWLAWRGMDPATRPRLVTTVHGFNSVNRYSEIMTCGERVICVSESIRDHVLKHYPRVDETRLRVIHRGIDPAEYPYGYRPDPEWVENFHREFPATRGKRLLTLPGRITRLKGHEDLAIILKALAEDESIHGLIAGGAHPRKAAYLDEIKALFKAEGLADRVTFTGGRSDLREILAISSLVLSLTTQPESFGRTTLEALGLGVPVAGYDHGGVGEQLKLLYPAGRLPANDPEDSVALVRGLLEDPPKVPREHPFTLDAMLEGTMGVYGELLR
ncbi:glycosyltransferase family 4 protein [Luteolibacter sp. GHJ8]|uniref:Glycosyltransferase family 4 protein n=1 Tax=Luteolibacter rhizosphaerae TaxID=2989719 RepID=A0ABT3G462_9BACT|nr:glycosyltransferase family 4 protein [Luteolibacter rhizosphaerae]MCW1914637.1 glycosyltransferase family 4 protein [Luteolibacter rhizosphaerae]